MSKENGGHAFPYGDPTNGGDIGMTLRDYFAAQSLATFGAECWPGSGDAILIAQIAYSIADAMLAERVKDGQS